MTVPTYLPYLILTGNALTLVAIIYGLNKALADAAWQAQDRVRVVSASITWARMRFPPSNMGFCCRS